MHMQEAVDKKQKTLRRVTAALNIALICVALPAFAYQAPAKKPEPPAFAPPAPTPNDTLRSPEVHTDGHVTFRLYAPKAQSVTLHAEGAEATPGMTADELAKRAGGYTMARGENGVWSYDLGPIQPGAYRYSFTVDGVQTTDPRNPVSSETLNSVRSIYEVTGAPFEEYKADVPHGAIASVWYNSHAVGGLRRMHVYTPPGYEKGDQRYPVFYLLHGGGDTDDSWPTVGRAGAILDNLIAAHQAAPMIVVMPAGHVSRDFQLRTGQNTMGHDQFNEDLTGSVVPYIDSAYRTVADREHRALAGLSMGGLQALTVSLINSDLFSYIGIFSSGWFQNMREQVEKTDLTQYKTSGKPYKLYWVGVGKLDIAYANSGATVELLKKYGITPVTHESEGFHAWNNWRDYLHIFAPQLFH
jgi:enterochelin esterase-like enzyme